MDSRIGLDYIVENKEYTAKLGSGETLFLLKVFWQLFFFLKFEKLLGKLQLRLKANLSKPATWRLMIQSSAAAIRVVARVSFSRGEPPSRVLKFINLFKI